MLGFCHERGSWFSTGCWDFVGYCCCAGEAYVLWAIASRPSRGGGRSRRGYLGSISMWCACSAHDLELTIFIVPHLAGTAVPMYYTENTKVRSLAAPFTLHVARMAAVRAATCWESGIIRDDALLAPSRAVTSEDQAINCSLIGLSLHMLPTKLQLASAARTSKHCLYARNTFPTCHGPVITTHTITRIHQLRQQEQGCKPNPTE